MGVNFDNIHFVLRLDWGCEFLVLCLFLGGGRPNQVMITVGVVEFVKLFIVLEHYLQDWVGLGELVQDIEAFGVEHKWLYHHLLSQDHEDEVLETTADDHVADGCAYELLEEPLLCLLVDEKLTGILLLVTQLDPNNNIKNLINILEFVVGTDLIDLVQFGLKNLLVKRVLQQFFFMLLPSPLGDQRSILH